MTLQTAAIILQFFFLADVLSIAVLCLWEKRWRKLTIAFLLVLLSIIFILPTLTVPYLFS